MQIGCDEQQCLPGKGTKDMVPRAVQDAGYTAVGLGVLALQEVQTRRRDIVKKVNTEFNTMKAKAAPVTSRLDDLPRLPGPIGAVIELGRARLADALRPAA
jgi:predicted YcjX-like family ATPase